MTSGQFGPLDDGPAVSSAGAHGPVWIIVNPKADHLEEVDNHLLYLVPDSVEKDFVLKLLSLAVKEGLMDKEKVEEIVKKVLTYQEFINTTEKAQAKSQGRPVLLGGTSFANETRDFFNQEVFIEAGSNKYRIWVDKQSKIIKFQQFPKDAKQKPGIEKTIDPDKEFRVGRKEGDYIIGDPTLSSKQFSVVVSVKEGNRIVVRDLGSKNGTKVKSDSAMRVDSKWDSAQLSEDQAMNSVGSNVPRSDLTAQFKEILRKNNSTIKGIERVNPVSVARRFIQGLQWNLFEMDKDRYLELFALGDNTIVSYGIVTLMNGNAILRFHSLGKDAGQGDYWASVYKERVTALANEFARLKKAVSLVIIPTDQILSEDQVYKRAQFRMHNVNQWIEHAAGLVDHLRRGVPLTDKEKSTIQYKSFGLYYSFGPAANFYINKLGFELGPTSAAVHKAVMSPREFDILRRLHAGEILSDLDIVELFSGRGVARSLTSFTLPDKAMNSSKVKTSMTERGGIDFNSDKMNLETRNQGGDIQFHLDPAQLAQLQNAPGFTPVIINIQPMTDLSGFLGLNDASLLTNPA
ncbi:MAG: FHA domain-containing protein, partial [Candidatus Omnitrophica bacterium]|nr:FHA domain-containing protein [Candidatus Omnitrophota bacterium]